MPVKKGITAWSFSRWRAYEECPFKAKLTIIVGLREPVREPLVRGRNVHEEAAKYLAKGGRVPASLKEMAADFRKLRKRKPIVEQQWAFTSNWKETGWFGDDTWARVVVDAFDPFDADGGPNATIIDHKTGKVRGENVEQLELYALAAFAKFENLESVRIELWYVDHGIKQPTPPVVYERKQMPTLKKKWNDRVRPMLNDRRFAPRPGNHCRWCHWRKANGGPCRY